MSAQALMFATLFLEWLPVARRGVEEAWTLLNWGAEKVKVMAEENRDPTDAEWAELNAMTDRLRTMLHSDDT